MRNSKGFSAILLLPIALLLIAGIVYYKRTAIFNISLKQNPSSLNSRDANEKPTGPSWPTFHGNRQRTGLSPHDTSHVDGSLLWTFSAEGGIEASPAIGDDGTIYFGAMDGYVYAVNKDGTLKWKTKIGTPQIKGFGGDSHLSSVTATPAIDKLGNVYITSRDQYLFALDSEGKIKWKFQINISPDHWGSPLIGDDGTIYVNGSPPDENFYEVDETIYIRDNPAKGGLYAINPDGTLKWHYHVKFRMFNSPAMDKDGTIYIAVLTGYNETKLIAFNQDGTVKWEVEVTKPKSVESSPSISDKGVIYLGSFMQSGDGAGLFAVTKDGVLWHHEVGGKEVLSTPAIAKDGTIYIGSMTNKVFAINPDGTRKWEFDTGGKTVESSSAIGADGTIYFGVNTDAAGKPNFFALNPDGAVKWKFATKMHVSIMASPAIGSDGTVYIAAWDGNLYAFGSSEQKEKLGGEAIETQPPAGATGDNKESKQFVPYGVKSGEWYPTDDTDCGDTEKERCEEFFLSHPDYDPSRQGVSEEL